MGDLPQIPSYDVGLGLASAVLLFLATYLLARPRTEPRAESPAYGDSSHSPIFASPRLDPSQRGLSFVGSLFAHLMLVAIVPSLQILSYEIPPIEVLRYEIITLDYRMPLPPVVSADELDPPDSVTAPAEPAIENEELAAAEEEAKRGNREGALSTPARAAAAPPAEKGWHRLARWRRDHDCSSEREGYGSRPASREASSQSRAQRHRHPTRFHARIAPRLHS